MSSPRISPTSRFLLAGAAILLVSSLFFPLWRIDLFAPQYPEGLKLLIHAHGLHGNVDIINGLNHYIGMHTLEDDKFIEFTILPYLLVGISIIIAVVAWIGKRKGLYALVIGFVLFCIISMADFYRWNYDYGHNLDPNAAIQVPGMSYQPPLIGFKQLLNFGAYAFPALGGFLFMGAAALLVLAGILEYRRHRKTKAVTSSGAGAVALVLCLMTTGCFSQEPRPVQLHKDACAYCKMSVSHPGFAATTMTSKGRQYFFDDIGCMVRYANETTGSTEFKYFVADYCTPHAWLNVSAASLLRSEHFQSPMAGNIAAFSNPDSLSAYQASRQATPVTWQEILKQ